jgi:hypothetical protein
MVISSLAHSGGEFTSPNQEKFHHYKVSPPFPNTGGIGPLGSKMSN